MAPPYKVGTNQALKFCAVNLMWASTELCRLISLHTLPVLQVADFDIMFGSGISRTGSLLDSAVAAGITARKGAWYRYALPSIPMVPVAGWHALAPLAVFWRLCAHIIP